MEWVVTTAKSLDEAKDRALDQLGVAADEAEFELLEEPTKGLFGRTRGEARVRARVRPAAVRPKQDRRNRTRGKTKGDGAKGSNGQRGESSRSTGHGSGDAESRNVASATDVSDQSNPEQQTEQQSKQRTKRDQKKRNQKSEAKVSNDSERESSPVTPQEVGDAAVTFMSGLVAAFGADDATTTLDIDGTDLDVRSAGSELGLLIGPSGRTLTAVQDLARVASQRRLGDHDTRLRIDVAGYRERRREALENFTTTVAEQVKASGSAKALEPMPSADRKVVHDTVASIDGVTSRSDGDDAARRVVITPE